MPNKLKKYETIAACGIDCGLCPRFYTEGDSACPGCGGENFYSKHPSCGVLTCCVVKNGFETCAECENFPCKRFDNEKDGYDSFVTHKKMFPNLENIRQKGITNFVGEQKIRMDILMNFLTNHNDGRSKSFFCQACTLLPAEKLKKIENYAESLGDTEVKERCKSIKKLATETAESLGIDLNLHKKSKK